jgi:Cu-Zn family superoxide dismutase
MNSIPAGLANRCLLASVMILPVYASAQNNETAVSAPPSAVVKIEPLRGSRVNGTMTLEQTGSSVTINGTVNGLTPGKHGFHVHEGRSCSNRGGHFTTGNVPHGAPNTADDKHHVGDLGNVVVSDDGTARFSGVIKNVTLTGPNAIDGRVLVVHQGEDDTVSQPSGKSGEQIGCGVIKVSGQ